MRPRLLRTSARPPPLRAFQALVAAAAARWKGPEFDARAAPALEWLEGLGAPDILAPAGWGTDLRPYRLYVPNNAGDLVTKAWAAGNGDASIASHRTEKDCRPTRLAGDPLAPGSAVRFLWRLPDGAAADEDAIAALAAAARGVTHLGWGVDMAAAHAGLVDESEAEGPAEGERPERWVPGPGSTPLRVPQPATDACPGTFRALVRRHEAFTERMAGADPRDVPPLIAYTVVGYRCATDVVPRPFIVFDLWRPPAADREPAGRSSPARRARFSPWRVRDVAGMLRNTVDRAARTAGWDDATRAVRVHGHTPDGTEPARGDGADLRFSYVPLPSVEYRGGRGTYVSDIIRVMVTAHPSLADELRQLEHRLVGSELLNEGDGECVAVLRTVSPLGTVFKDYCSPSCVWSTVTPVVLPGHEDPGGLRRRLADTRDGDEQQRFLARLDRRVDALLRKALLQVGLPGGLVSEARLSWQAVGFRRGVEPARRYTPPRELTMPRYHVRVRWPAPVCGPLILGAGRYRGFGVFVSEASESET